MRTTIVRQAVVALTLGAAAVAANALPMFTFTPGAVGLAGTAVTADNLLISDFSKVTLNGSSFTETGLLSITNYQMGGMTLSGNGLGSTYGLYIAFTGTGTVTNANPSSSATTGTFNNLTYTLYGYNGSATFGLDANGNPTETAQGEFALASGSLLTGGVSTLPVPGTGSFTATAFANLSLTPTAAGSNFFTSPNPFYNVAISSFVNSFSQVTPTSTGFTISQGGGSINFASAVPEPETYALMLAGLGVVGFVARRRQQAK